MRIKRQDILTISDADKLLMRKTFNKYMEKVEGHYNKNPEHFHRTNVELRPQWAENARLHAAFEVLKSDGIFEIKKEDHDTYSFEDHCGDAYCPITCPDIDPKILKAQKAKERARFNRLGVHFMTLVCVENINEPLDSIGGFVGNDFYGSGYDTDFYRSAVSRLPEINPRYAIKLNAAMLELIW